MNIYLQTETDFNHNGLGFLTDVLDAKVTDNLNGDYSLSFKYKINGSLNEYIQNENIVKCKVSDGTKQLFIIKNITKTFDSLQVNCKHIFYQLLDNFLEDVAPTNLNVQQFLQWILDRTSYKNIFTAYSDISTIKSARYVRRNPVDCILGNTDNSMANLFNGELKRDNFNIYFNKMIGTDNGVKLIIGKNITGINISIDTNSIHTRIMPQGFDGLLLPEKYVDSSLIDLYSNPKIYKVEFSEIKYDPNDENAYQTTEEAYDALRSAVQKLFDSGIDKPLINVKVDWIELSKANEYKNYSNLERVDLGDTITIELLGISYKSRIIKTVYNPLTDRIESFEIGTPKANIGTSTNQIMKEMEKINPASILESAKNNATQMIINAMGGYVYKTQNELFIMDTDNPNTAMKIWRWNMNGLGYSNNGIDGPYETAITSDGKIVADFITTGKLDTSVIEGYDSLITQVSNIDKKIDKTSDEMTNVIKQTFDTTTNLISQTGGTNLLKNTQFYQDADEWNQSENVNFEVITGNVDVEQNTTNKSELLLKNGTLSQEFSMIVGKEYTIAFKYKKEALNNRESSIRIYRTDNTYIDVLNATEVQNSRKEFSYTFVATVSIARIEIYTNNDDFSINDLIIQSGTSTEWSPNATETRGLGHKLSGNALELYDLGTSGEKVILDYNNLTFFQNSTLKAEYGSNNMQVNNAIVNQTMNLCGLNYTKIDDDNVIVN